MSFSTSASIVHTNSEGFFYIIQTADVPLGVYKIGKTTRSNPNRRLCEYPKFSCVKYTVSVNDCHGFESYVMRKFRLNFERCLQYGLEYYKGDIKEMINLSHKIWNLHGASHKIIINKSIEKIKPNGFQYFINNWYINQIVPPDPYKSYLMYKLIMQKTFMTNDYSSKSVFITYLNRLLL
jgi:hypothetical protein